MKKKKYQITTWVRDTLKLAPRRAYAEIMGIDQTILSGNRIPKAHKERRTSATLFAKVEGSEELYEVGQAEMFWLAPETSVTHPGGL